MQTTDLSTVKSTQLTGSQHRGIPLLTFAGHTKIWGLLEQIQVPAESCQVCKSVPICLLQVSSVLKASAESLPQVGLGLRRCQQRFLILRGTG